MRRKGLLALMVALVVVLPLSIAVQAWTLPSLTGSVIAVFPETAALAVPAVVWGVLGIACWQGVAVIGVRRTALARHNKAGRGDDGWLRAMTDCLLAYLVLAAAAFIALIAMDCATPGVMLGLLTTDLAALAGAASLAYFQATRPVARRDRPAL